MKIKKLFLAVAILLCSSCSGSSSVEYVEVQKEITYKYYEQVQEYNWFLDKYKLVTNYYFVLDEDLEAQVERQTYYQYEVGDMYTILERVN